MRKCLSRLFFFAIALASGVLCLPQDAGYGAIPSKKFPKVSFQGSESEKLSDALVSSKSTNILSPLKLVTVERQSIGEGSYCNVQILGDGNHVINICHFQDNPDPSEPLDFNLTELVNYGKEHYKAEHYPTAQAYFNYVLNHGTFNSSPRVWMGITNIAMNRCNEAIQDFEAAISMEPRKGPAYAFLAYLQAWYINDLDAALRNFNKAKFEIESEAIEAEIDVWIRAFEDQAARNQLPEVCPASQFRPHRLLNLNLARAIR